jgi:hypothetical protein
MMDLQSIEASSRAAAKTACKNNKTPYIVWLKELADWKLGFAAGKVPSFPFPFLGSYVPKGWKLTETYFVDSSGFGETGEAALTIHQFLGKIKSGAGYAVTEAGQFQVYIGEFEKTAAYRAEQGLL